MHLPHQQAASADGRTAQPALTAQPHQQPLGTLRASPGTAFITVDPDDGGSGIVLATSTDRRTVRVCLAGEIRTLSAEVAVVAVTDAVTVAALRQGALAVAVAATDAAETRVVGCAARIAELQRDRARQLAAIRSYAIDRHLDDEICLAGLTRFLEHFGLEPYDPRHEVAFTITGTVTVIPDSGRNADDTADDVRDWLRLDTSDIDGADEDNVTCTVTVDAVEVRGA